MADQELTETIVSALTYGEMTRDQARTDLLLLGVHQSDVDRYLRRATRRRRQIAASKKPKAMGKDLQRPN